MYIIFSIVELCSSRCCRNLFHHVGAIEDVSASADGLLYCTIAADKALKVFDVMNFGMFLLYRNASNKSPAAYKIFEL